MIKCWGSKGGWFYCGIWWNFFSIRFGRCVMVIKPTKDEFFSQRNGYWHALRFWGWSILVSGKS